MVLRAVNEDLLTVIPEATAEVSVLRNSMPGALKQSSSCPSAALEGSACELHTCISLPESYSETILIRNRKFTLDVGLHSFLSELSNFKHSVHNEHI